MPTVTAKNLQTLPDGEHTVCDNLFLRVRGKSRVFIFRYVSPTDGTRRKLSIGPVTRMPLPEARNEAARCRLLLAKGVDPKAARDALAQREEPEPQPEVVTFGEFWRPALHEYAKIRRIEQKTVDTYEGQLENHLVPKLGNLPLSEITPAVVADALRDVWTHRHTTGINARMVLEQLFTIAIRDGLMTSNPALWRGNLSLFLPPTTKVHVVKHREAPTLTMLREALPRLLSAEGVSGKCVAFTILLNILINTSCFSSKKRPPHEAVSLTGQPVSASRTSCSKHFLKPRPPYFEQSFRCSSANFLLPSESLAVAMRDRHFSVWLKTSTGLSFGA